MRSALPLLLATASACTLDLRVGRVQTEADAADSSTTSADADADTTSDAGAVVDTGAPDAGDPDSGAPDAGADERTLQVGATPSIACGESLGGHEAMFAGITAADVSLTGGAVAYRVTSTSVILEGPLLTGPFQTTQLVLREDVLPDQPPGTYLAAVPILDGPAGPDATRLAVAAVFVDTLLDPPSGEAGFQYDTANQDGACFVSFSIVLLPP